MNSNEFVIYLNDKNNLLENYEYNLDKVCQERVYNNSLKDISDINEEKKNNEIGDNKEKFKKELNRDDETKIKLKKIHQEIDSIKNTILMNNFNFQTSNNNSNKNSNKNSNINIIKKMKLRKYILNENVNSDNDDKT